MEKQKITSEIWTELEGNLLLSLLGLSHDNVKLNKRFDAVDTLFHYTSLKGFISIIETQSFYCTNVNFLNDSQEFKYGVETILLAIENIKLNVNSDILEQIKSNINLLFDSDKYVTCFSKSGDSLSQWRAYGNDGKGISLGFGISGLNDSFDPFLTETHIEYDKQIQLETIEEFIRLMIDYYDKVEPHYNWKGKDFNKLVSKVIIRFLNNLIHAYKHPAFIDENEYRLQMEIKKEDDINILFRASEKLIIPYTIIKNSYAAYLDKNGPQEIEPIFSWKKMPLKEIIIGPNLDYDIVKNGLEKFLLKNGYENVKIVKSLVPYRN